MTVYGGGRDSGEREQSSHRGKAFATVATIVVAAFGLLSSPVWGPPICRAVRVCGTDDTAAVSVDTSPTANAPTPTSGPTSSTPTAAPTSRSEGTGYPSGAGDYCDEFVRAWQDGYRNRATDLSNAQVVDTVFKLIPPTHYRNDWGPTGTGAQCTIIDLDRGNAQLIRLSVRSTGKPGAITAVTV